MEYQIAVNKYELHSLIDALRSQLQIERERFRDFCRSGDMVGADLQGNNVVEVTMLLGKFTAILQKGDK
jgi:hypothetical protein